MRQWSGWASRRCADDGPMACFIYLISSSPPKPLSVLVRPGDRKIQHDCALALSVPASEFGETLKMPRRRTRAVRKRRFFFVRFGDERNDRLIRQIARPNTAVKGNTATRYGQLMLAHLSPSKVR